MGCGPRNSRTHQARLLIFRGQDEGRGAGSARLEPRAGARARAMATQPHIQQDDDQGYQSHPRSRRGTQSWRGRPKVVQCPLSTLSNPQFSIISSASLCLLLGTSTNDTGSTPSRGVEDHSKNRNLRKWLLDELLYGPVKPPLGLFPTTGLQE